jgi:hypothetical protein
MAFLDLFENAAKALLGNSGGDEDDYSEMTGQELISASKDLKEKGATDPLSPAYSGREFVKIDKEMAKRIKDAS